MTCRLCGSTQVVPVVDLGRQRPAGHFPSPGDPPRLPVPLQVVLCLRCSLAQLSCTVPPAQQFCGAYGYRSGLNEAMVVHLHALVDDALARWGGYRPQTVLDIGCNDGTLLAHLPHVPVRVGMDPGPWLADCPSGITQVQAFFPDVRAAERQYDLIFSVAMFYDLEDPLAAATAIRHLLAPGGLWVCEVADWSLLVRTGIWDGICHEHLTYWTDEAMFYLATQAGLHLVDISRSTCNGGSSRYYFQAVAGPMPYLHQIIPGPTLTEYGAFQGHIEHTVHALYAELDTYRTVHLYGASTKANVVLQRASLGPDLLPMAAERSPEKVGRTTATGIPIVAEDTSRVLRPEAYLVGPWHFQTAILRREYALLEEGTRFIFPLPHLCSVSLDSRHLLTEAR